MSAVGSRRPLGGPGEVSGTLPLIHPDVFDDVDDP